MHPFTNTPATTQDLLAMERRLTDVMHRKIASANRDLLDDLKTALHTAMQNTDLRKQDIHVLSTAVADHETRLKRIEARYAGRD